MCRLVSYLGPPVLLDDVIVKPMNSLVRQSLHARESEIPTNGDGFGLGWYTPSISRLPAVFKSISPAWNDRNLLHLTAKIESPAFFAHVRAASAGGVAHDNCHPFLYQEWLMMHNGGVEGFKSIKRHLRRLLDDDLYAWIEGGTDSEHVFALFLQRQKGRDLSQLSVVADVLEETIREVLVLVKQFAKTDEPSYFNMCVTDGERLLAARYCSDKTCEPASLHYALGQQFVIREGYGHMLEADGAPQCILVSSERLTQSKERWQTVPPNHMLLVDRGFEVSHRAFS